MKKPALLCRIVLASAAVALALAVSGCMNPMGPPPVSVTIAPTYSPPTFTPIPTVTTQPTPTTTPWNGEMVRLYGNVTVKSGEHVYGTVKVSYLDKNYWDEYPTAKYDTDQGGSYSMSVRANVPFKVTLGYLYTDRLPYVMNTYLYDDKIYTLQNDMQLDFEVKSSNATQVK
ncbi:MAG TPA: hypothetical protein VMC84_13135 [Methanocella sp.]|uniref:hypothetical protein n=1 Tax=Methanocella sp. TaxID=2052833 RepID=UPI002C766D09|nr:hypothetical protein [Methanocella sp.]HTY92113.1 hypothetical protein [Methanocella sp.]